MTTDDILMGFLLLISLAFFSAQSEAAMTVTPSVPGYSGSQFKSSPGNFTMAPANDAYIKQSIVNVGGKAIPVTAKMKFAANAAQYAKSAMRLNPTLIVGTLAGGWLIDQGYQWMSDQQAWSKPDTSGGTYPYGVMWRHSGAGTCGNTSTGCSAESARDEYFATYNPDWVASGWSVLKTAPTSITYTSTITLNGGSAQPYNLPVAATSTPAPATNYTPISSSDWDALPDPLPAIAPEMPHAPYMPEGAPVSQPVFDPADVPIGEPYTRPDGSTAQQRAKISPAGDGQVTIDTYDQPLTDPAGNPLAEPAAPVDTEENPGQCDKYPDTLGCAELGEVPDTTLTTETRSIAAIAPVSVGGVGSCPAPIVTEFMGQPLEFSYQIPCDAAEMLKPLILVIAWISAGVIFIGGVRQ